MGRERAGASASEFLADAGSIRDPDIRLRRAVRNFDILCIRGNIAPRNTSDKRSAIDNRRRRDGRENLLNTIRNNLIPM